MSSSINWTPELLAECRNKNCVAIMAMSSAARDALIDNGGTPQCEWLNESGNWVSNLGGYSFAPNFCYRLAPSYVPPELEPKKWADMPVRQSADDVLLYRTRLGNDKQLVSAASCASFVGYVYADGSVTTFSRNVNNMNDGPAVAPIAVRFWKG